MSLDPLYAFYLRWAWRLPLARAEEFRAELALLVTSEQARERRRLCADPVAYRTACAETEREAKVRPTWGH